MGMLYGLTIILFLLLIVEILAIALKITGLDMDKARFQVISIITNTGFTTRESELITQHPTRRRIAQILMLISYVGTATLIAFILNILNVLARGEGFLYLVLGIAGAILLILFLSRNLWILRSMERYIEKQLKKQMNRNNKRRTVEEVLKLNDEYGVAEFIIEESSGLVGIVLEESDLKQRFIQVLNVDRGSHIVHFPDSKLVFQQGDKVVVYGQLDNIQALILEQIIESKGT